MTLLSATQLADYERDGFLVLKDFVSTSECLKLEARATELLGAFDPGSVRSIFSTREQTRTSDEYFLTSGDRVRFFFEEDAFLPNGELKQSLALSLNKIGHALHDLDPVFARFSRTPQLAALAAELGFTQPLLLQSMYIFKQPNIGGEVVCHQDATFLYTEPVSVTGFWFALEDATIENGCLWALPGGHRQGLKARFVRTPEGTTRFEIQDETLWPQEGLLPLEAPQGTLVILHGLLPHLSYVNRSPQSRHAYALHIIEGTCHYPDDNWLQRCAEMPLRSFGFQSLVETGTETD